MVHAGSHRHSDPADQSCLPLKLNPCFMAERGDHFGCPHPLGFGRLQGCGAPRQGWCRDKLAQALLDEDLVKAFKGEKRLISTLLPLGVGALMADEQKMKWNY